MIQIPNICPFKEEILKDVEADKARREEEKKQNLEKMRLERLENRKKLTMEAIASSATERGDSHVEKDVNGEVSFTLKHAENLLQCLLFS